MNQNKKDLALHDKDTGSSEVQIAGLTKKIEKFKEDATDTKREGPTAQPYNRENTREMATRPPAPARKEARLYRVLYCALSSFFKILPVAVMGSDSLMVITRGYL